MFNLFLMTFFDSTIMRNIANMVLRYINCTKRNASGCFFVAVFLLMQALVIHWRWSPYDAGRYSSDPLVAALK